MAKYYGFEGYLSRLDRSGEHRFTFAKIENILGFPLPASARTYPAWWANQRGPGHSQSHSWMNAGWHSGVIDLKSKQVTFRPVALAREPRDVGRSRAATHPLTIAQAKAGVALGLGIKPADVEITIRA